jgi:hypothetical protein
MSKEGDNSRGARDGVPSAWIWQKERPRIRSAGYAATSRWCMRRTRRVRTSRVRNVELNHKQRFVFNEDRSQIRASQGHTIPVERMYQMASMGNLNALLRLTSVLVTGDRAALIRRWQTEADVFRRDVLPAHLVR